MQIFGGHGYIREWGMEQNVRDARIATLYEGTTGIQAMDLLGRKIALDGGQAFALFYDIIQSSMAEVDAEFIPELTAQLEQWQALTQGIMAKAADNVDELGASAFDYLMYSGYTLLAWFWARMATVAKAKLADNEQAFYRMKIDTARFYFSKLLPRSQSHRLQIENGSETLMSISIEDFKEAIR